MSLRSLRNALSNLYSDPDDALRIGTDADLDIRRIDYSGSAYEFWQATLAEAEKSGRLLDLINVAVGEYPEHSDLLLAAATYVQDVAYGERSIMPNMSFNGRIDRHDDRLDDHDQRLTRIETAGTIISIVVVLLLLAIGVYVVVV